MASKLTVTGYVNPARANVTVASFLMPVELRRDLLWLATAEGVSFSEAVRRLLKRGVQEEFESRNGKAPR